MNLDAVYVFFFILALGLAGWAGVIVASRLRR